MKRKIKIVICVAVVVSIILIGCGLWYFEIRKDVEISNVHFEIDTTGNVTLIFNIKNLGEDRALGITYRLCDPKSHSIIFVGGNTTRFSSGEEITIHSIPIPTWHLTWEEYSQKGGSLPVIHIDVFEGRGINGEKLVGEWQGQAKIP